MTSLPYETSTAGDSALAEIQKILSKFGCARFGTMIDAEAGKTIVQFEHRGRNVSMEASWKGYAAAWLRVHPYRAYGRGSTRGTRADHEARALEQAKKSVCSVLRDWVKGQIMAVECGVMSFEAAFLSHMLLPTGERVGEIVERQILPALPCHDTTTAPAS